MELYKRENISPFAGCLTSILQIVLLFSIFFLVRSPLTHMVKMEPATIEKYITEVKKEAEENGEKTAAYPEIALIKMAREKLANSDENEDVINSSVENEVEEAENKAEESRSNNENEVEKAETADGNKAEGSNKEENEETTKTDDTIEMDEERKADYEKMAINMDFLGVDLSNVPSQDMSNPTVFIIPALYVISSFISIWISTNSQKKMQKESSKAAADDPMSGATKSMMWFMPIMSISIAIIAPLGLALYWLVNNILMTIERLIMDAFIKVDDEEEKKPIEVKRIEEKKNEEAIIEEKKEKNKKDKNKENNEEDA